MTTPAPDINSLLAQLREQWLEVVEERDELRVEQRRLRETLRQAREFICEATWGKGARARDAERMVLQMDLSLSPITDSDHKGPSV